MKLIDKRICIIAVIVIMLILSFGLILPQLISTNKLPAWMIVVLAVSLVSFVVSLTLQLLRFLR